MNMLYDFTKDKYDIIIQAGQSNSEGYGYGDTDEPYAPNDLVWYMNGDFTISQAAEIVIENDIRGTFVLSFAREYVDKGFLEDGRKLLILRCAVGGTGFAGNRWDRTGDLYLRMLDMIRTAKALNEENRIVAFLWHQGETDAMCEFSYDVHYENLKYLLDSVRTEFDIADIPFIAGDFVQQWKSENLEISEPIVKAVRAVCRDCGNGYFVESEGLLSNMQELGRFTQGWEDHIHFSRRSLYRLGKRYFEKFMEYKNS